MEEKTPKPISEPVINTEINEVKPITICAICNSQNLVQSTYLNQCNAPGCSNVYCLHFASPIDPHICLYCLSDVVCTEEIGRSTHSHKNDDTGITHSYTRRYKSIKFSGLDWLFQQRKISSLNNTELQVAIEYHRAILNGMIFEREHRREEQLHRNKNKGTQMPDILAGSQIKASNTTIKVKKTRTTSIKNPAEVQSQVADIIAKLSAKGVSLDALAGMLGKK
jgi:hypothetical protein